MPIMAKSNDEYTEVKAIKTPNGTEIDYVLSKMDNTYKRTYTAIRELEDAPPLEFKSIKPNANLIDYRIYGQTSRNLFDEVYTNIPEYDSSVVIYKYYYVGDGTFTLSSSITRYETLCNLFLLSGKVTSGASSVNNGVWAEQSQTVQSINGYITIAYRNYHNIDPRDYNTMLNTGSTPLPYEPYGESVGDRTGNLFDEESTKIPGFIDDSGRINTSTVIPGGVSTYDYIECSASTSYYLRAFTKTDPSSSSITQRVAFFDGNKDFISRKLGASSFSFTTPENCSFIRLSLDDNYQNIVLMQGSTEPTEFIPYGYKVPVTVSNGTDTLTTPIYLPEPLKMVGDEAEYVDFEKQKQHRVRKNLLQNTATSQTINGVAFTVNSDGSVTCNGTATQTAVYILNNIFSLEPGAYNLTGCPAGGGYVNKYKLDVVAPPTTYGTDIGNGSSFTLSSTLTNAQYRIVIYDNQTCNNLTFYPMIRKADIEDDSYEPYIEDTDLDVTLPALPTVTGTNVLTVGTEVQPSDMYIKGNFKMIAGGGE